MRFAANAENRITKGQKNKRYNACVSPLSAENISKEVYIRYTKGRCAAGHGLTSAWPKKHKG